MYFTALSIGFVSSLHCLGMCGPLALLLPGANRSTAQLLMGGLVYNAGRILTYTLLGLFLGWVGQALVMADLQQAVTLILGILLVIGVLLGFNLDQRLNRWPWLTRWSHFLQIQFQRLLVRRQHRFYFGLLNGLLPCGMVYLALAGALSMQDLWSGAAFMLFFGLGTLPAMLAPFLLGQGLRQRLRGRVRLLQLAAMLLMGVALIVRGLAIQLPANLNFWAMIQHPVMCH